MKTSVLHQKFLTICSILFLIAGSDITTSRKLQLKSITFLFIRTFVILAASYYQGIRTLLLAYNGYWCTNPYWFLESVPFLILALEMVITYTLLSMKRRQILQFVNMILIRLPASAIRLEMTALIVTTTVTMLYCIVIVIFIIQERISTQECPLWTSNQEMSKQTLIWLCILDSLGRNLSGNFILYSMAIYLVVYRLVVTFTHEALKIAENYLNQPVQHGVIKTFDILSEALSVLREFDSIFSMLPLVWLTHCFMLASRHFISFWLATEFTTHVYSWTYVIENICTYLLIFYMSNQKEKFEGSCSKIYQQIVVSDPHRNSIARTAIMEILHSLSSHEMTAAKTVNLNRSLILSFLGMLVTFTVLFVNMTNSGIKP